MGCGVWARAMGCGVWARATGCGVAGRAMRARAWFAAICAACAWLACARLGTNATLWCPTLCAVCERIAPPDWDARSAFGYTNGEVAARPTLGCGHTATFP